ncbi:hypothetical protein D9M70_546090 [compost metagenome]
MQVFGDIEAVGQVQPAVRVVVFEAAVVIGRGQVEHGTEDFQSVTRCEIADEVEEMRQAIEELAGVGIVGEPERA